MSAYDLQIRDEAWLQEEHKFLSKYQQFEVGLKTPSIDWYDDIMIPWTASLPAHDLVLRPILKSASVCYVYGVKTDSDIYQRCSAILCRDKGKFRLDLSQEVLCGHEILWNSQHWTRGSIIIIVAPNRFKEEIFSHCSHPEICTNVGIAHTRSALNLARRSAETGQLAFCLPASNGIDWMDVFAPPFLIHDLFDTAVQADLPHRLVKHS